MTPVFADTHHFVALLNPRDGFHGKAKALQKHLHRSIITTEYVMVEVGATFADPKYRARFLRLIDRLEINSSAHHYIVAWIVSPRTWTLPATIRQIVVADRLYFFRGHGKRRYQRGADGRSPFRTSRFCSAIEMTRMR